LPTTVSPRYAPEADRKRVGQSPAEALNPPVAFQVPYSLDLTVTLEMPSAIRGVESPTHPLSFELDGPRGTVRLGERIAALDRDFVLKVRLEKPHAARAWVERDPRGTVALLAFLPRLSDSASKRRPCEAIFVVDRSGSMGGTSIEEARNALQLCLRSLDTGSRFNVVGFGSTFQTLFPESRPYDDASLAEATRYVAAMDADLGGTEILPALEAVLSAPAVAELPRQVFLLTDGEVTTTDEVISLAASHAPRARIFTFGIGAGASAHLVRGIARAGRGEAELIAPGERIEAKVVRQLSKALSPALTDVAVDWGGLEAIQAPYVVPPVFIGGRVLVYGFVKGDRPATVTLSAQGPDGPISESLVVDPTGGAEGDLIATLAARALIRDLEEGVSPLHVRRFQQDRGQTGRTERVKEEIVRLGTTYSLASRETSFVAVEHRKSPLGEEAVLRRVPVALTRGWGGMMQAASMKMTPPAANAAPRQAESLSEGSSLRPVDRLVALQRADGRWELTRELADLLGLKLRTLEKLLDAAAGDPEKARRALATSLALRWLNVNVSSERGEWALLAAKAQAWLDAANVRARDGRDVAELAAGLI
ncbi:MAG TPA: VWA domain-containing protein, partial [Thermoanaerobaculia bacterium]